MNCALNSVGAPSSATASTQTERPNFLYKYLNPDGIVALQTLSLKCTPPAAFSDVLEGFHIMGEPEKVGINTVGSPNYLVEQDPCTGLSKTINRDEFEEWFERSINRYPGFVVQTIMLVPEARDNDLMDAFFGMLDILDDRNVLCLTELPDSPTMWDYYAKGHTGFLLGFDANADFLTRNGHSALEQVRYSERPSTGPREVRVWHPWITKHIDYVHEKEWRAFYSRRVLKEIGPELHVVEFSRDDLSEVIVGARAADDFVYKIKKSLPIGVPLRKCSTNASTGRLVFDEI